MSTSRMTWDEMVNTYPNMWVVIKNPEMNGPDIVSGDVVDVKNDEEIITFRVENQNKGFVFYRTSEGDFYGVIDADFNISID